MVISALADLHIPIDEPIDLINVAFGEGEGCEFDKVPDRVTGINR